MDLCGKLADGGGDVTEGRLSVFLFVATIRVFLNPSAPPRLVGEAVRC
jgi:hypothetical protein